MARINWENGIVGAIPRAEWLDIDFRVNRQNDPIDRLFGDERTNNLVAYWQSIASEYQLPMMAQFHGFDTESKTTFRIPIDTHNIEKGLIKVKINQSERLRELIRNGVQGDELVDYVIDDGVRLADQVITRTKVAKNEALATGKVTIKENGLDLSVDYGVPSENMAFTLDLGVDADIPSQIQTVIDAATASGKIITGIITSRKNIAKMRNNSAIQTAVNGDVGVGALVRNAAFNSYLEDEFGITQVITNDLTYGASSAIGADGRPTVSTKRYFPDNVVTFFAASQNGTVGTGLWGDPPEAGAANASTSGVSPYVYITQWEEVDPRVLWTKASALFMPVLFDPASIFIATVNP